MYLNYFGLVERPFSIAPDPQYLYMSARHREAMAHLSYGLSQGGCFIVLTGEVGTGKTTLCRNLLADLPDNVDVALILNPNINRRELLETVCDELKISYPELQSKKRLLDSINDYLLTTYSENRHTVLIIDEAQLLSRTVLEQVRLLTNLETTKSKLLQIILIGQPELNDLLGRNDLRQLAQRVTARYHLPAISKDEIQEYVNFRLSVAGCKKPLFSSQALKYLHNLSGGIPRKINVMADQALLATYAKSQLVVDSSTIKQAAKDVLVKSSGKGVANLAKPNKVVWAIIAAAILMLNIGLWWWFTGNDSSEIAAVQNSASQNNAAAQQTSSGQALSKSDATQQIDLSQLAKPAPQVSTITKPSNVTPGSVVIADEFLDGEVAAADTLAATNGKSQRGAADRRNGAAASNINGAASPSTPVVVPPKPKVVPAYLATSAFGRVLEVSPDRTGRIAAFKNLAAAWDVDLPDSILRPLCTEIKQQGVECLPASSWNKIIRFNRPTIMVLAHKGKQHRVILYKVENQLASVLVGEQNYELPVAELRDRWADNAMVFWRPSDLGARLLRQGDVADTLPAIRKRLNVILRALEISTLSDQQSRRFDAELATKTEQLQRRFGLQADGHIGRETYLLMNEMLNQANVPVLTKRS